MRGSVGNSGIKKGDNLIALFDIIPKPIKPFVHFYQFNGKIIG